MMHAEGLLKGHKLALDSSLMDANAAMRSIVRKDTNETYSGYVERLASASGEPAVTRSEQARFDKKREKRTTSNADWASTTDPEAKIAKMKDGRTHLAYKPEHAVDIDSGAIIAATVNPADSSDHSTATNTLVQVTENLEHIELSSSGFTVVADKGYHSEAVIAGCVAAEIKTCIAVPQRRGKRNWKQATEHARTAITRNRRRVASEYGKRLLRKRGETVERSFAHLLNTGRMRRSHLRGLKNVEKRYLIQACAYNLGLMMRKLIGFGTPRGLGAAAAALVRVLCALWQLLAALVLRPKVAIRTNSNNDAETRRISDAGTAPGALYENAT